MSSIDSLHTRRDLVVGGKKYIYYSLRAAEEMARRGTFPAKGGRS